MGTEILFISWAIAVICGALLGNSKGQLASGIIWTVLFSFLGLLVILCLPDRKKQKAEADLKTAMDYHRFKQSQQTQAQAAPTYLRIAKGGQDLGLLDIPRVKLMMRQGELTLKDYYFDDLVGDWQPIDLHPDFVDMAV